MAVNCLETGDCENAMKLFRRSESIITKVYGEVHPKTSDAFNNMGSAFHCLGMFDSSLIYFNKALEIRKKLMNGENFEKIAIRVILFKA